ncbi:DnaJ domain-containing protein [Nocardioides sp. 503]|uniref:DnaJ domain-containing protein n=1 Tax=Nocardioides sp. 503 TaxID=2508326 RepID=UPI00106F1DAD|nr:DnaJ domain-containing protein [Nocardioides sp. 503]
MTPHWYDLLDVERDATPEEIRAAWRAAIADLEPDDRRFRVFNEAGAVLLDPERRAAYDATLPPDEPEEPVELDEDVREQDAPVVPEQDEPVAAAPQGPLLDRERSEDDGLDRDGPDGPDGPDDGVPPSAAGPEERPADDDTARSGVPVWLAAALAVLALAVVAATVFAWTRPGPVDEDAARAAARAAVVPVLSYDYRTLDEDAAAARTYLTPSFRKDYDDTFTLLEENAPRTKTVVSVEEPLADAVVRSGEDHVDVLLYVNQPTSNAQGSVTFRNQVTLSMRLVDGKWLVDDLRTDRAQR